MAQTFLSVSSESPLDSDTLFFARLCLTLGPGGAVGFNPQRPHGARHRAMNP